MQPLYEFGGEGPVLHLALANGFPPQVYGPMVKPLLSTHRVICLPPRALWTPPPPPESMSNWHDMAADLLRGLRERDLTQVIAVGHSMGGVASTLAAMQEPGRFKALVLLDPTFLPPWALMLIRGLHVLGKAERFPLVQAARRRRKHFASREDAVERWRHRSLFRGWPDETLWLYAHSVLRSDAAGTGFELAWSADWEARYFATVLTETWRILGALNGLLPVLVIRGETTDTFRAESERAMRRRVPDARYVTLAGQGHLFPMSAADETAQVIAGWLQERGL